MRSRLSQVLVVGLCASVLVVLLKIITGEIHGSVRIRKQLQPTWKSEVSSMRSSVQSFKQQQHFQKAGVSNKKEDTRKLLGYFLKSWKYPLCVHTEATHALLGGKLVYWQQEECSGAKNLFVWRRVQGGQNEYLWQHVLTGRCVLGAEVTRRLQYGDCNSVENVFQKLQYNATSGKFVLKHKASGLNVCRSDVEPASKELVLSDICPEPEISEMPVWVDYVQLCPSGPPQLPIGLQAQLSMNSITESLAVVAQSREREMKSLGKTRMYDASSQSQAEMSDRASRLCLCGAHATCKVESTCLSSCVSDGISSCTSIDSTESQLGHAVSDVHLCADEFEPFESSLLDAWSVVWLQSAGFVKIGNLRSCGAGPTALSFGRSSVQWLWNASTSTLTLREPRVCWRESQSHSIFHFFGPESFQLAWSCRRVVFIGHSFIRQLSASLVGLLKGTFMDDFDVSKLEGPNAEPNFAAFEEVANRDFGFFGFLWRPEANVIQNHWRSSSNAFYEYISQAVHRLLKHYSGRCSAPTHVVWGGYAGQTSSSTNYACAGCLERSMQLLIAQGGQRVCQEQQCRFMLLADPPVGAMLKSHCQVPECIAEAKARNAETCSAECQWSGQRRFWSAFHTAAKHHPGVEFVDLWETGMRHKRVDHIHYDIDGYTFMLQQLTHNLRFPEVESPIR